MKLLTSLLLTTLYTPSLAWGTLGHRTTVALALLHIPPSSRTWMSSLLNDQDPTVAALWPDQIRYIPYFKFTAPWHYIDTHDSPPHSCHVSASDCSASGCVVSAIANHTARLVDLSLPDAQRAQSLKFVMHFFGDVHMPLHNEGLLRGGNGIDVTFDGVKTSLHSVWDTLVADKAVAVAGFDRHANETEAVWSWAAFLMGRYGGDASVVESVGDVCVRNASECALEWATGANCEVCGYVLAKGQEWVETHDLGGEYFEGALDVVERMIMRGGRRLAAWLKVIGTELDDDWGQDL